MDRVNILHFDGSVTEQFELVSMRSQVLSFQNRSSFNDLVARVR
jgi:prepilin-type processing-associated H-X9-DG protein